MTAAGSGTVPVTPQLAPRWVVAAPPSAELVSLLASGTGLPRPLAALLAQRGFTTVDAARNFLRPSLEQLTDPHRLKDMDRAVDAIVAAVRSGTVIAVNGDYDVDGQCSTAILVRTLRIAGAAVVPFIPHRLRDGYDFGPSGLAAAEAARAGLIITCDSGINAHETVREAEERGIRVVITDHHLPGPVLPPATAVVNPQRSDDDSGLGMLCGAGIAWMMVRALTPRLGLPENFPLHLLDLVALATVADVVPLVGENRIIVRHGLRLMADTRWAGLHALLNTTRLVGKELEVLVEGPSDEHEFVIMGRHAGQAPDIDGQVYLSGGEARPGEIRRVSISQASDYDLVGELIDADADAPAPLPKRKVGLRVLQTDGR